MSMHYGKHASQLVAGFKDILDPAAREAIGTEEYEQLAMLIESAITTSVLAAVEKVADDLQDFARNVRTAAEHYDP